MNEHAPPDDAHDPNRTHAHIPIADPHDVPPRLPDRYTLEGEIARGGMGVVYRVRDSVFDRLVAVKVLHTHLLHNPSLRSRFLDEARITGQLQHPGIPPVHDTGTLPDGRPFLTMKLVKGDSFHFLLHRRNSPSHDRGHYLSVFESVCQVVGYAHSRNVVHRDLKPENIMVGRFGEIQVIDWGLAKVVQWVAANSLRPDVMSGGTQVSSLRMISDGTDDGTVLGSPAFMSPEQACGIIPSVDARSDVFGLGGVLCVILTGHPPYPGTEVVEVVAQAANADLSDAYRRLDACEADATLIHLCKRCLSHRPADRPEDGAAVAAVVREHRNNFERHPAFARLGVTQIDDFLRSLDKLQATNRRLTTEIDTLKSERAELLFQRDAWRAKAKRAGTASDEASATGVPGHHDDAFRSQPGARATDGISVARAPGCDQLPVDHVNPADKPSTQFVGQPDRIEGARNARENSETHSPVVDDARPGISDQSSLSTSEAPAGMQTRRQVELLDELRIKRPPVSTDPAESDDWTATSRFSLICLFGVIIPCIVYLLGQSNEKAAVARVEKSMTKRVDELEATIRNLRGQAGTAVPPVPRREIAPLPRLVGGRTRP